MTGISELIFLDRYAQKDPERRIQKGDTVVALVKDDPQFPQKGVGVVEKVDGENITVRLKDTGEVIVQHISKMEKPIELKPWDMWDRMAKGAAVIESPDRKAEMEERFRNILDNFRFSPGGRINVFLGTDQNLTAYNCYVIPIRDCETGETDSREAIIKTLGNMVELMARGGGVGINLSTLRPRLAPVAGVNGRSSGSVSWGGLFSFATGLVEQGGSRRGALMLILNDWHPDILEFVEVKRDMAAMTNANISVGVSNAFVEAVKNDGDWDLVFPDTSNEYYSEFWDGDIKRWKEIGGEVRVYKTIKARDLWNRMMESAWLSAEPGVVFLERMNDMSNSWYFETIHATNPCVTGDTLISTTSGLRSAASLHATGETVKVITDSRLTRDRRVQGSHVFSTGVKPVSLLTTREGLQLRLTDDHKVLTERGWVEAKALKKGDKLFVGDYGKGFGPHGSFQEGMLYGWLVGDGTTGGDRPYLSFFGEKRQLATSFASFAEEVFGKALNVGEIDDRDESRICSTCFRNLADQCKNESGDLIVPDVVMRGSASMQRGFLKGLFSADGHVENYARQRKAVVLSSISLPLLSGVQQCLLNLGIYGRIYKNRKSAGRVLLPDGKGGMKKYRRQALHDLRITKDNILRFSKEVGFALPSKRFKLDDLIDGHVRGPKREKFLATFESLTPDGEEEVYDLTVPGVHAFVANGLVVHNCAEQALPPWGVCNLGHINLSRFVTGPIGKGQFEWKELETVIQDGVRFLDNIIDITPYFVEENKIVQMNQRRIGMGTMGLGEALVRLGLRYGSDEAIDFVHELYQVIANTAYQASATLAYEKGSFPKFEKGKFLQGRFVQRLNDTTLETIEKYGMRNVALLTQAPTGSTGTMIGTSTGIEPYYSWTYWRKGRLGTNEVREKIVDEYFSENPHLEKEISNLPDYFVTAMELTPQEHLKMQAAIQQWTDSSISKTINLPKDYPLEACKELYIQAYDLGCKGVTIYRDGCRDEQVLSVDTEKGAEPPSTPWTSRPEVLMGATHEYATPVGKAFITINQLGDRLVEVFLNIGKAGSDVAAMSEALGRLSTLFLKYAALEEEAKLQLLVDHLSDIGGSNSMGMGPNRILSLPDAMSKVFKSYLGHGAKVESDLCPSCGQASLIHKEGCYGCDNCGFSRC
jgi:ribonucleoside-diphosphate reductase alpha chain